MCAPIEYLDRSLAGYLCIKSNSRLGHYFTMTLKINWSDMDVVKICIIEDMYH